MYINTKEEVWKSILGYEGRYKVSNNGDIINSNNRPLKQYEDNDGYKITSLYKDGKSKTYRVHRLAYEAFNGKINNGNEINHLNFKRGDNRLSNLEVVTRKGNVVHSKDNMKRAKNSRNSKVTPSEVKEIRALYESGDYTQIELAKRFGLKKSAMSNIVNYKNWKHV